jgi:hypothetical protein
MRAGASDDELLQMIRGAWLGRNDRYSELRGVPLRTEPASGEKKIEMYYIGG